MTQELYRKHRPTRLSEVMGQPEAVAVLTEMIKNCRVPHALLLSGPSGVGKTTLARILKRRLKCSDHDWKEINAAESRGIDTIREIQSRMGLSPVSGKCRIFLLDEIHKTTTDAQTALLKLLEDPPGHVYFFLCTTDPGKLLRTVVTRCTEIQLRSLDGTEIAKIVADHLTRAGEHNDLIKPKALDAIVEAADGSARKAVVLLNQVMGLATEEEMVEAIQRADGKRKAIDLARALIDKRKKWPEIAAVLKDLDDDPETVRHAVLGYARKVLLDGGNLAGRAVIFIDEFGNNFYDSKAAGLCLACFNVYHSK